MKKLLLALAVVPLVAAGCARSAVVPAQTPTPQAQPSGTVPTEGMKDSVHVNSVDDAAKLLEDDSDTEQMKATSGDDSDLMSSSSAELDDYANVTNDF